MFFILVIYVMQLPELRINIPSLLSKEQGSCAIHHFLNAT